MSECFAINTLSEWEEKIPIGSLIKTNSEMAIMLIDEKSTHIPVNYLIHGVILLRIPDKIVVKSLKYPYTGNHATITKNIIYNPFVFLHKHKFVFLGISSLKNYFIGTKPGEGPMWAKDENINFVEDFNSNLEFYMHKKLQKNVIVELL